MKKILLLIITIPLLFLSCSKDNDGENIEETNVVYGTKWYTTEDLINTVWGGSNYVVIEFSTKTEFEYYIMSTTGNIIKSHFGKRKYTCKGNTVTLYTDSGEDDKYAIYEIKGRYMEKVGGNSYIYTSFTRQ